MINSILKIENVILQTKFTALNKIRKIYHPKAKKFICAHWDGETQVDLRDDYVKSIILKLESDLSNLKIKKNILLKKDNKK